MLNKTANLQDVYFPWLRYFQLPSLLKYLNITAKSVMHGLSLYISHSLTTDTSLLSFKILDSDTEHVFNKKLKMRLEGKSCFLQNLHFLKAVFGQPDTYEEKQDYVCACLGINCADQVSRTRGSVTEIKDRMRKFFVFFYHPCYFQAGKVLLCQLWRHPYSLNACNRSLYGGKKPTSWYSQHLHNTRKLYPLMVEKGLGGGLFLPLLPHENAGHLKTCDHISPTALRGLETDEDAHVEIQL